MPRESEVKFGIPDPDGFRERLDELADSPVKPRHFEHNVIYSDPEGQLAERRVLLRLRWADDQALLTVKSEPRVERGMKVREEVETQVEDPDAMDLILKTLGFTPAFIYEKYRTEYRIDGLLLCLDETPIGTWVEIEGEEGPVSALAGKLHLDPASAVTLSYPALFKISGGRGNMTF